MLAALRHGRVVEKLDEQIAEIIRQIQETGKAGEVTLKLKFSPHGRKNKEIHIKPAISAKLPPMIEIEETTIFFGTGDGGLSRDDTEQGDFFVGPRPVGGDAPVGDTATG